MRITLRKQFPVSYGIPYTFFSRIYEYFKHGLSGKVSRGGLDLAVLFTTFTPNKQNRNQVLWKICAGVLRHTPSSAVMYTEQSCDLFQNKMVEHCLHVLSRLIYTVDRSHSKHPVLGGCSGVLGVL